MKLYLGYLKEDGKPMIKLQPEQWSKSMKHRQNLVEEKVDKIFKGMSTFSTTIHGVEAMFQTLKEDI